jgi:hypothetical protein
MRRRCDIGDGGTGDDGAANPSISPARLNRVTARFVSSRVRDAATHRRAQRAASLGRSTSMTSTRSNGAGGSPLAVLGSRPCGTWFVAPEIGSEIDAGQVLGTVWTLALTAGCLTDARWACHSRGAAFGGRARKSGPSSDDDLVSRGEAVPRLVRSARDHLGMVDNAVVLLDTLLDERERARGGTLADRQRGRLPKRFHTGHARVGV